MSARPQPGPSRLVAAGYIQAVLAGDDDLVVSYRRAFTDGELLEAVSGPIRLLGRYLGYHTGKTTTEVGDALMRASRYPTKEQS